MPCHHRFDGARNHTTRRDCDTRDAAGHMIRPLPGRASHGDVPRGVQPQSPFLRLFHWHFKPLTSPQAFDTLVIHLPACISQQGSNPSIAISAVLAGQLNHVRDQALLVSTSLWHSPLCGSVLAQNTTNATLRNLHLAANRFDAGATSRRAQKFPRATFDRINLSNVRSETARRRRSFSFWSRFSSLSCSVPIPPYMFGGKTVHWTLF